VRASLQRRVERLEARCRAAAPPVRYVWWRGRGPYPEPAEGERLVVLRWQNEDDDTPPTPETMGVDDLRDADVPTSEPGERSVVQAAD